MSSAIPVNKQSNNNVVAGIFKHDSNLADSNVAPFNTPDLKNKQNGSPAPPQTQGAINRICDVRNNASPQQPVLAPNGASMLDELIRKNDNVQ